MRTLSIFILSLSILFVAPAFSAWKIDKSQSSLTFVSIKKGTVAENHHFNKFSGGLSTSGEVSLIIDLNSVDTKIAIRDTRMAEFLFETTKFSAASFSAKLNNDEIDEILVGSSKLLSVKGFLDLHGQQQEITLDVMLARLSENSMVVTTMQPIVIKAQDFELVAGINKLQALASLPSIAYAVPVSFVLMLKK